MIELMCDTLKDLWQGYRVDVGMASKIFHENNRIFYVVTSAGKQFIYYKLFFVEYKRMSRVKEL